MWEQVNELTEAHLEVDCNMVCAMCDLTCTMSCMNVGVLSVAGARALPRRRGKGRRGLRRRMRGQVRAEVGVAQTAGLREEGTGKVMVVVRMVVMMMPLMWSI